MNGVKISNSIRYILGSVAIVPLLPVMYYQGKSIRAKVPRLREATGPSGYIDRGSAEELSILYIGESTIAGVGVNTHEEGFAGTFSQEISAKTGKNVKWQVYARTGYNADNVCQRLLPLITENAADLVIVGLGGNDAFELNSPWRWRKDIITLIEGIRKRLSNTPIVFVNMPPIKSFPAFTGLIKFCMGNLVEILGNELKFTVDHHDRVYFTAEIISLDEWMQLYGNEKSAYFSDGIHPSALTYQTWARETLAYILDKKIL